MLLRYLKFLQVIDLGSAETILANILTSQVKTVQLWTALGFGKYIWIDKSVNQQKTQFKTIWSAEIGKLQIWSETADWHFKNTETKQCDTIRKANTGRRKLDLYKIDLNLFLCDISNSVTATRTYTKKVVFQLYLKALLFLYSVNSKKNLLNC